MIDRQKYLQRAIYYQQLSEHYYFLARNYSYAVKGATIMRQKRAAEYSKQARLNLYCALELPK